MAVPTTDERRFVLRLQPTASGDDWGFAVDEATGGQPSPVTRVSAERAGRYRRNVLAAVTAAGYPPTAVGPRRRRPFNLTTEPGVRLVLTVGALKPVSRADRRIAITEGIAAMSTEEALYWYSHSAGPAGQRALRALRLLLAEA